MALVDHFYEIGYETGQAVRWRVWRADGVPMAIASLWQRWTHPQTAEVVVSFSMLTVNADTHPVMREFHRPDDEKRSPLILADDQLASWLDADMNQACAMVSAPDVLLRMPTLEACPDPVVPRNAQSSASPNVSEPPAICKS